MRTRFLLLNLALAALALGPTAASAQCFCKKACCQQYRIVEEVCYKEVVRKFTVPVPDVKKVTHWIYDNRSEDFAAPCCTWPHCGSCKNCNAGCNDCPKCGPVWCRAPLIKRLVIEEVPITKCIVQCVVETVPCVTYRKVPCGAEMPGPISESMPHDAIIPPGAIIPPVAPLAEPIPVMPSSTTIAPYPAPAIQSEQAPAPHPVINKN